MDTQQKKKLSFITIGLIFLLSGIEYAVILPTIWRYLQILDAPPFFLGLGLSAFSLSGLLSGPLFGHWSDRTRKTKTILLLANVFEIVGIGAGAGSSIFGYLTRNTVSGERAQVFAAIMACRQAGLLIGPAFNIFLRLCDFKLGPFVVNKYTSPGLFMCGMWLLLQLAVALLYWDLSPAESSELQTVVRPKQQQQQQQADDGEEEEPLMGAEEEPADTYGAVIVDPQQESEAQCSPGRLSPPPPSSPASPKAEEPDPFEDFSARKEFLREEVIVLLTTQFITLFNQTALETMVTPLTQRYFGFGELGNSVMYSLCGVEVILGFFFVRWLSSRVADRAVLAAGLVICAVACVWCLLFLAKPRGGYSVELAEFGVGVFLQLLGLPFVAVATVSLFSKVTAEKTQGFSQGVRRSIGGVATILGPLWAGGLTGNLYLMLGMMMALLLLVMVMVVLSYERLVEPPVVQHASDSTESEG
ncbi:major facilitator superfamily domain-containing protein 8 isoform X2 [Sardina pilchardus]|uniref:major facilitator superfamily domain-containing protein 8 isoform X2 n=1 Tax=Sardina pilchardus TaxID=27697 RepID=UPI002E1094B1